MATTWVTTVQVQSALGLVPVEVEDSSWLTQVTDAANEWAYRRRQSAGYDDAPDESPGEDATLGVILYAVALYRERGAVDGYASFTDLGGNPFPTGGTMGQIMRLLGIGKPVAF